MEMHKGSSRHPVDRTCNCIGGRRVWTINYFGHLASIRYGHDTKDGPIPQKAPASNARGANCGGIKF